VGRWIDVALSELKGRADDKKRAVEDVVNMSTQSRARIEVTFKEPIADLDDEALSKLLKLSSSISLNCMYMFNAQGQLRKYTISEILREHHEARLELYARRKDFMLKELQLRLFVARNKAAFIQHVVAGRLELRGHRVVLEERLAALLLQPLAGESYEYLLKMPFSACTTEKIESLCRAIEEISLQVEKLQGQSNADLWLEDLAAVEEAFEYYTTERLERNSDDSEPEASRKRKGPAASKRRAKAKA
jgi:DNA topoisomerase-2